MWSGGPAGPESEPRVYCNRQQPASRRRAVPIIRPYQDQDFSLTDATSFAVTERLRIGRAFSSDRDFAQDGFLPVGPS